MDEPESVEFFFDPICPWAYQTSLWIREVQALAAVEVKYRFFSLEEINHEPGAKHPWERAWTYGWSLMRVGALLRRQDPKLLDHWYLGVGHAFHEEGRQVFLRNEAEDLAVELGLGHDVVARAMADQTTHDDVLADHRYAVERLGAFGVPTLAFKDRRPVFGPVITPAPTGAKALRLWEVVTAWTDFPFLYEMRTPKREDDFAHIAKAFDPYLAARRWESVQNPVA
ncbi:MAG TPA: DsbA family protein [Acidimicrobiales bacterium]|nr:DsbA family protein [Acidimicrobiales bacterium]